MNRTHSLASTLLLGLCLFTTPQTWAAAQKVSEANASTGDITVYVADKIITMDPALPEATAVAVADGRIVSVGSLESLRPWTDSHKTTIDRRYEKSVLMPGFIDPHVHPSLPAVLTQFPFVAPDDWSLPTGEFPAATTPEDYIARLQELAAQHNDPAVPFIAWGYHPLWHGKLRREDLNRYFPDTPVMLWHRSFHELIGNDAAFNLLGISEIDFKGHPETNWEEGHVWENGALVLLPKMPFLFAPQRYGQGMVNFIAMLRQAGVTTALDMGVGIFGNAVQETQLIRQAVEASGSQVRIILTPIISHFLARGLSPEQAMAEIDSWRKDSSANVLYDRRFKLMLDGAMYSGLGQYQFPGYIDGHQGQWMAPFDVTYEWARTFWKAGYQLHAHSTGDGSVARMIDIVKQLQIEHPRVDHRTSLEHFAYATTDQSRVWGELGGVVSANPYYQYILSDIYSQQWLGEDRGRQLVPLGTLERLGVPFALHSDAPMAPLDPLLLVWTAVNRVTLDGNNNAASEKITVDAALRAVTIDAAWVMGWEQEIGSIRAGKRADFVALDADPYQVAPAAIRDIKVLGTVFEGKVNPARDSRGQD